MRLLLASLVLAIHYLGWLRLPAPGPFDGIAVVGFFFLSGYWIARLWAEKYSRLPRPLLTFYISRALRIYPLATLATLAMVALPHAHPHGMWRVLTNLALFGISLDGGNAINPPVWSLGTEVQFYLLAPFLIAAAAVPALRWLMLAVGTIAWLVFVQHQSDSSVLTFLLPFALGIMLAGDQSGRLAIFARRWAPYGLLGTAAIIVTIHYLPAFPGGIRGLVLATSLLCLPYIATSLAKRSTGFDRVLGDLAYPVFLLHTPVIAATMLVAAPLAATLSAVVVTAVASLLVWAVIDRPLERFRRNLVDPAITLARPAAPL